MAIVNGPVPNLRPGQALTFRDCSTIQAHVILSGYVQTVETESGTGTCYPRSSPGGIE